MTSGIYSIVAPSGHKYIGSSINIDRRWGEHLRMLKRQGHVNPILQNAWNKYEGQLEFNLLLICLPEDLLLYEQQYLDFYKPEYNICQVAGNTLGVKLSEESRLKRGEVWRGRKHTEETRKKMSESSKGRKRTPEHQAKIAAAKKGKPTKPCSEERKLKISLANKGRKRTGKAYQNILLANKKRSGIL